jgi:hypothetical protein
MNNELLGPGGIKPIIKKRLPFPLENIDELLADLYSQMDILRKRIEVIKRNNVTNFEEARLKKLNAMQYKFNTAMALVKRIVIDLDDFWL